MDDHQRLRYSRHLLLDEWSEAAQDQLLASHALVIGAGGLGAPALMYLASAGVGRITVVDPDTVDITNLQRQIVHTTERVGQPKVLSAELAMAQAVQQPLADDGTGRVVGADEENVVDLVAWGVVHGGSEGVEGADLKWVAQQLLHPGGAPTSQLPPSEAWQQCALR